MSVVIVKIKTYKFPSFVKVIFSFFLAPVLLAPALLAPRRVVRRRRRQIRFNLQPLINLHPFG